MRRLPSHFYLRSNVILISRELIGKFLVTRINEKTTAGMIVETEAYAGPEDKASHAFNNRKTTRTEVMFRRGGVAYVYLCYGIHHLFNVVTNREGIPHAILIRAVEPADGIDIMARRRRKQPSDTSLTRGPGAMSQALGIRTSHTGLDLNGNTVWIEDRNIRIKPAQIGTAPRIGVDYAGDHAARPWRFFLRNSTWVSKQA